MNWPQGITFLTCTKIPSNTLTQIFSLFSRFPFVLLLANSWNHKWPLVIRGLKTWISGSTTMAALRPQELFHALFSSIWFHNFTLPRPFFPRRPHAVCLVYVLVNPALSTTYFMTMFSGTQFPFSCPKNKNTGISFNSWGLKWNAWQESTHPKKELKIRTQSYKTFIILSLISFSMLFKSKHFFNTSKSAYFSIIAILQYFELRINDT